MKSAAPEPIDHYFESFSAYLRSGEIKHLSSVFPGASDFSVAAVYRNGFLRASIEALRASYPVVDALVGKEYFDYLANSYVDKHPPHQSTFIGYGLNFPGHIRDTLPQHQLAYLADFAELDKAWLHAYFANDSALLSEQDIEHWKDADNDIDTLAACLPASARLLTMNHQVSEFWRLLKAQQTPPESTTIEAINQSLLVWRDTDDQIKVRELSAAEYAFLSVLAPGSTLGLAALSALHIDQDFPVVDFFSELLTNDGLAVQ